MYYHSPPCPGRGGARRAGPAAASAPAEPGAERQSAMPKMKTRKTAAKRFKRTASGRFKRTTAGRRHLLSCKSRKRKRQLRGGAMVSPADHKRIALALAAH